MKKKGEGKFDKEKEKPKFTGDKKGDKFKGRGSAVSRPESVKNRGSKRG